MPVAPGWHHGNRSTLPHPSRASEAHDLAPSGPPLLWLHWSGNGRGGGAGGAGGSHSRGRPRPPLRQSLCWLWVGTGGSRGELAAARAFAVCILGRRRRPEGSQPAKEPLPGRSCRCCCDRGTVSFSRSSTALICKAAAPRPPEGPVPTANVRSTPAAATAWRAGRGEEAATPPRPHPGGLASPAAPAFATRARSRPSTLRRDPVPAAEGPPLRRPRPETQDGRDRVTDRLRIPEPSRRERAVARTWRGSKRARAGLWCRLLILIA